MPCRDRYRKGAEIVDAAIKKDVFMGEPRAGLLLLSILEIR
jgi:hypothetical protein